MSQREGGHGAKHLPDFLLEHDAVTTGARALYKLALALDVSDMWLEGYDVPMERSQKQKEIDFKNNLYKKIAQDMDLLKTISQYYNLPEEKQKTIRDLVDQMSR